LVHEDQRALLCRERGLGAVRAEIEGPLDDRQGIRVSGLVQGAAMRADKAALVEIFAPVIKASSRPCARPLTVTVTVRTCSPAGVTGETALVSGCRSGSRRSCARPTRSGAAIPDQSHRPFANDRSRALAFFGAAGDAAQIMSGGGLDHPVRQRDHTGS